MKEGKTGGHHPEDGDCIWRREKEESHFACVLVTRKTARGGQVHHGSQENVVHLGQGRSLGLLGKYGIQCSQILPATVATVALSLLLLDDEEEVVRLAPE